MTVLSEDKRPILHGGKARRCFFYCSGFCALSFYGCGLNRCDLEWRWQNSSALIHRVWIITSINSNLPPSRPSSHSSGFLHRTNFTPPTKALETVACHDWECRYLKMNGPPLLDPRSISHTCVWHLLQCIGQHSWGKCHPINSVQFHSFITPWPHKRKHKNVKIHAGFKVGFVAVSFGDLWVQL